MLGLYLCAPLPSNVGVLRHRSADGAHAGSTHIDLPRCHDAAKAVGRGRGEGMSLSAVCEGASRGVQTAQPGSPGLQEACEWILVRRTNLTCCEATA